MNRTPYPNKKFFPSFLYRVFLLLLMAGCLTGCESRKIIVNDLDEKEANEILVFLSTKGVDANKVQAPVQGVGAASKGSLWNISVETSQASEAMALLNQAGLPRRRGQNLLNIFSNSALVPSGMQEKIRYQAGLGEQIASTIRKIDGVLDADVQISFPEEDPLNPGANKQKITASVYVKHSGVLDDPNSHLVTRIKRLVAGSINGLDFDNVTVVGDRARFSDTPGGFQGALSEEDRPFVHVWTVTVAKDSLTRFQILFFSFTITILILLLALIWLLWKFLPILNRAGGFKELFSFHPLNPEGLSPPVVKEDTSDEEDDDEENDEESESHRPRGS